MKLFFFYIIQVIIVSGILYGYYYAALRNKRFHQYNRFYLLLTIVISIVVPLLEIPVLFRQTSESTDILQAIFIKSYTPVVTPSLFTTLGEWIYKHIAILFYIVIASILLYKFINSLLKIYSLKKQYPTEKLNDIIFIKTNDSNTPFSFFRFLFWNNAIQFDSDKGQQVFRHEYYHIRQKHSWDILFVEVIRIICWINPFFYLIRKEIATIHEFLADQFAITKTNKWEYAELLLMQMLQTNQKLVNPFFHPQIKRRIAMLTSSQQPSYQYARKIAALPITILIISIVAIKCTTKNEAPTVASTANTNDATTSLPEATESIILINGKGINISFDSLNKLISSLDINTIDIKAADDNNTGEIAITIKESEVKKYDAILKSLYVAIPQPQKITRTPPQLIQEEKIIFTKVEQDPSFPDGNEAWRFFLSQKLNPAVPIEQGAPAGTYQVILQFIVEKDGSISDLKPLTQHGFGMEEEAMRAIKSSPKWNPAIQNKQIVTAYKNQPITFVVTTE